MPGTTCSVLQVDSNNLVEHPLSQGIISQMISMYPTWWKDFLVIILSDDSNPQGRQLRNVLLLMVGSIHRGDLVRYIQAEQPEKCVQFIFDGVVLHDFSNQSLPAVFNPLEELSVYYWPSSWSGHLSFYIHFA